MENDDDKVPAVPGKNPFEDYADRVDNTMLLGALLKFTKGDYLIGRDGEECPVQEVVALMPGIMAGWIRWEDNFPVEHKMGLLLDGFVTPARATLGHLDQSLWDVDSNGKPRDPWQENVYLPVITVDADVIYTFTTSSDGGRRRAIAPLCREYGSRVRQHPDEIPVIPLGQDSYLHPDRAIGRVKFPLFTPIKRWVKAEPYLAAVMAHTGRSLKLLSPA